MNILSAHKSENDLGERAVMYFWPKNESALDNVANRRSRPYELWRTMVGEALRRAGFDEHHVTHTSVAWRQTAGCPCGCSPGFLLSLGGVALRGFDVHVDFEE